MCRIELKDGQIIVVERKKYICTIYTSTQTELLVLCWCLGHRVGCAAKWRRWGLSEFRNTRVCFPNIIGANPPHPGCARTSQWNQKAQKWWCFICKICVVAYLHRGTLITPRCGIAEDSKMFLLHTICVLEQLCCPGPWSKLEGETNSYKNCASLHLN
jgi:hypothetical protein